MKKTTAEEKTALPKKNAPQKKSTVPQKSVVYKKSVPKRLSGAEKTWHIFSKLFKIALCMSVVMLIVAGTALGLKTAHDQYVYSTYPLKYQTEVEAASRKYGVDKFLIYGVIKTESDFDPNAVSPVGAVGLMQLMPETFQWIQDYYADENYQDFQFSDLTKAGINIDYGTHLLSILLDMYENEDTALCAYNAGVGNVDKWLEDKEYSEDGKTLIKAPIEETENYRHLVAQNKSIFKKLYGDIDTDEEYEEEDIEMVK